jgi:hypothetical protein
MVSLRKVSKNAIYTAVLCSLLVVPVGIVSMYVTTGPPDPESQGMLLFGLVAMAPGVLMGGAALLVTAQG